MTRKLIVFALAAVVSTIAIGPEEAEGQVYFGPQALVWDFDEVGIGARVDVGLGGIFGIEEGLGAGLFGSINGNYLFIGGNEFLGDFTHLIFNANAAIPFGMQGAVVPYAGLGINRFRISYAGNSDGETGLNLLGGIFFDVGSVPAYLELQHSTTATGFLSLSFGVLFGR